MKGRKRHVLVDTLGLILAVVVHGADIQDRDGAKLLLERASQDPALLARLQKLWADGGYQGQLEDWVSTHYEFALEIVKRPSDAVGFSVLPHRWIVERTLAWLSRCRRFAKDYEYLPRVSEQLIHVAMIGLMVRRLAQ